MLDLPRVCDRLVCLFIYLSENLVKSKQTTEVYILFLKTHDEWRKSKGNKIFQYVILLNDYNCRIETRSEGG